MRAALESLLFLRMAIPGRIQLGIARRNIIKVRHVTLLSTPRQQESHPAPPPSGTGVPDHQTWAPWALDILRSLVLVRQSSSL